MRRNKVKHITPILSGILQMEPLSAPNKKYLLSIIQNFANGKDIQECIEELSLFYPLFKEETSKTQLKKIEKIMKETIEEEWRKV